MARPANSLLAPTVPFYDPRSPGLQYDVAKAKDELRKSGYPNGFELELMFAPSNPK